MEDKKDKTSTTEDIILKDFQSSSTKFYCEICNLDLHDSKAYGNHVAGKRHCKKVAEMKMKSETKIVHKESESEDSDDSDELFCEICNKYFTGYISYATHIKGSVHKRNIKKAKLRKQLGHMPEVIDKKEKEADVSDEEDFLTSTYARCSICKKEFSGPESFHMHLKSSSHLKKIKVAKSLKKLKEDEEENSEDENLYKKCETCEKEFSGLIPYKIHMKSKVHKKKLEREKIAAEIKQLCTITDRGYICNECKKVFTDPLALKSHLESNSHEKKKFKDAIKELLDSHPEIVYATVFEEKSSDGNSSDDQDYLICKLCNMVFTGPESAQDHVQSKKHITTKREKMMLRNLKEKIKFKSEASGGKDNETSKEVSSDSEQA